MNDDTTKAVLNAAKAWAATTEMCSCENTAEGGALLDAISALEARDAEVRESWKADGYNVTLERREDGSPFIQVHEAES